MTNYDIEQQNYDPVVPMGWFVEHTDDTTPSPHVATESEQWHVFDGPENVIAMALVEETDSGPVLRRIGVDPYYRRQGIATSLVEILLEEYGELTARCKQSKDANEFYEATGWKRVQTLSGDPEDLIEWHREDDDAAAE